MSLSNLSSRWLRRLTALACATLCAAPAWADLTIGVSLPMTGAASSLGIPMSNQVKLWPTQVAGEKLNVLLLDDAGDPSKGVDNARRFVQANADLVVAVGGGSVVDAASGPVAAGELELHAVATTSSRPITTCLPTGPPDVAKHFIRNVNESAATLRMSRSPARAQGR